MTLLPAPPAPSREHPLISYLICDSSVLTCFPFSGLFAPRQGQAYREEQRRRRSQFDRGTPGAENEMGMAQRYRFQDPALSPVSNNFPIPRY